MGKSKIIVGILCLSLIHLSVLGQFRSVDTLKRVYRAEIGVREKTGSNDGERVELYLASVGFKKGAAWCAAFVSWAHLEAGMPAPVSAWSPSHFNSRNTVYVRGGLLNWQEGDVFGLFYTKLNRIGHVGFIDGKHGDNFITVEGNTNEAGSREGDGVYRKRRPVRTIYKIARNGK